MARAFRVWGRPLNGRVERIFTRVPDDVDRILIRNATEPHLDLSFFYVTDLTTGLFEDSSAILHRDGSIQVIVPRLEETIAREAGLEVTVYEKREDHDDLLAKALGDAERVGFHAAEMTVETYERVREHVDAELVDVTDAIGRARIVKDGDELERIEQAGEIASRVLTSIPDLLRPGVREHEVASEIHYRMEMEGASGPAFDTIVAFGARSAEPHYSGGRQELAHGDLALIDFGAVVQRYRSDVTRTWVVGEPTDKQRRMYTTVLEAQQAAIDAIAPGVPMEEVHQAAVEVIDDSAFAGRFIHSTGHGLGLATHDGGALTDGRDDELAEGMVFTVEPGVYLPGEGGVRIEDDVVVTSEGCRLLTDDQKGLEAFTLRR